MQRQLRRFGRGTLLLGLALTLSCNQRKEDDGGARAELGELKGEPLQPLAPARDEARDAALRQKLNAYIADCTNRNSAALYRSREQASFSFDASSEEEADAPGPPPQRPPELPPQGPSDAAGAHAGSGALNPAARLERRSELRSEQRAADSRRFDWFGRTGAQAPGAGSMGEAGSGAESGRAAAGIVADLKGVQRCSNGVERVAKIEPRAPELERVASEYADALKEVTPLLTLRPAQQGQKTVDHAQAGRELRRQFDSAWERFAAANLALKEQIQTVKSELDERMLKRLAEEGPEIDYLAKLSLMAAQRISETGQAGLADPRAIDLTTYRSLVREYEQRLGALAAFTVRNPKRINEGIALSYLSESREFLASAVALAERVSDRSLLRVDLKRARQAPGSPVRLLVDFNEVIGAYNAAQELGGFAEL